MKLIGVVNYARAMPHDLVALSVVEKNAGVGPFCVTLTVSLDQAFAYCVGREVHFDVSVVP